METIAAIATAPGEGGIAIVRLSGPKAFSIIQHVTTCQLDVTHLAKLGNVLDAHGNTIDQALFLPMRAPRSFTGEDVIEIQCHGGSLVSKKVLERVLQAGAILAGPGEFSYRAFLNKKMDLTQAEAVQSLIGAKNDLALQAATKHLEGGLSEEISFFQKNITDIAAIIEAWIDFPEEGLEFASFDEVLLKLTSIFAKMEKLLHTYEDGKKGETGLTLAILGAPNAGKSSLMNALLKQDRAIVSPQAGTTRDVVEGHLQLGGLHFLLADTAGMRQTHCEIESLGIERSKKVMDQADLLLWVIDSSQALSPLPSLPREKTILVWNKKDLQTREPLPTYPHQVSISTVTKEGLETLKETIEKVVWTKGPPAKDEVLLTNVRQKEALGKALQALEKVIEALQRDVSPEFIASDLRQCLVALSQIVGVDVQEDILSSIFQKFCVGK